MQSEKGGERASMLGDLGVRELWKTETEGERENEGSGDDFVLVYCLLPS